jgi:hypothetical protein
VTRHSRQARLAEVGDAGQARLAAGHALVVAPGLTGIVQARYLAGAGVGALSVLHEEAARAAAEVDASVRIVTGVKPRVAHGPVPDFGIHDPAARDVATGAWLALSTIRSFLALPPWKGSADP